jgi:hypothetical protein
LCRGSTTCFPGVRDWGHFGCADGMVLSAFRASPLLWVEGTKRLGFLGWFNLLSRKKSQLSGRRCQGYGYVELFADRRQYRPADGRASPVAGHRILWGQPRRLTP